MLLVFPRGEKALQTNHIMSQIKYEHFVVWINKTHFFIISTMQ